MIEKSATVLTMKNEFVHRVIGNSNCQTNDAILSSYFYRKFQTIDSFSSIFFFYPFPFPVAMVTSN